MAEKVIIYTLTECDVCDLARDGLREQGVDFEERNVQKQKDWFDEALSYSIFVPIILRDGNVEIGWQGKFG